jgi:phosphate transport system substrate-binding protein
MKINLRVRTVRTWKATFIQGGMLSVLSFALALLVGVLILGGIPLPVRAQEIIRIDGSSTVYPVTEAVAEEFQKAKRGKVKVTVGISGTGGGFKKFCRGETDISDASRPILKAEMDSCKQAGIQYFELPVAYDALTVMVNPKNNWVTSMDVAELKKIWEPAAQGKITRWNHVRSNWPDRPLKLFGAGADSGTFDYFTEAIVGKAKASRGDFTASEDDNVLVQGIANDTNALGFFGYSYYAENQSKLKAVAIDGGKGPVMPSGRTVEDGTYQPLSRPIFIYVSKKSAEKAEVKEFVDFYLKNASNLVRQVKYVSLPPKAYTLALEHFQKGKFGTVFGGEAAVGVKIEELLTREAKF